MPYKPFSEVIAVRKAQLAAAKASHEQTLNARKCRRYAKHRRKLRRAGQLCVVCGIPTAKFDEKGYSRCSKAECQLPTEDD